MNNGNVKLTDGSKPKVAKNTLGKTPVSIFAGFVRSMRLNRKQRLLLQRQAILRRELNGFSNHMFDDLGMTSDIASTSDITGIALLTGSEFINTLSNSVNLNDNCSLLHKTQYENQSAACRLKPLKRFFCLIKQSSKCLYAYELACFWPFVTNLD